MILFNFFAQQQQQQKFYVTKNLIFFLLCTPQKQNFRFEKIKKFLFFLVIRFFFCFHQKQKKNFPTFNINLSATVTREPLQKERLIFFTIVINAAIKTTKAFVFHIMQLLVPVMSFFYYGKISPPPRHNKNSHVQKTSLEKNLPFFFSSSAKSICFFWQFYFFYIFLVSQISVHTEQVLEAILVLYSLGFLFFLKQNAIFFLQQFIQSGNVGGC